MAGLKSLGSGSVTTFLEAEGGKLAVEMTAAAALKKGQPVKLNATEGIVAWDPASDVKYTLFGYCQKDCASGEVVTVYAVGFAMIWALSKAAQASGPVKWDSYDGSTNVDAQNAGTGGAGYNVYAAASTDPTTNGWSLDTSAAAGELIRVVLR